MILIFQQSKFQDIPTLSQFFDQLLIKIDDLSIDEITKIIAFMDEINFDEHFPEMYTSFSDALEFYDLSIENSCILLVSQTNKRKVKPELVESFIQSIIKHKKNINITNYIDIWLCLAKLNSTLKQDQKTALIKTMKLVL